MPLGGRGQQPIKFIDELNEVTDKNLDANAFCEISPHREDPASLFDDP